MYSLIFTMIIGKDCIGCAKTGSGKTAAFALPILHQLSKDPYGVFALVITPTRYGTVDPIHNLCMQQAKLKYYYVLFQRAGLPDSRSV